MENLQADILTARMAAESEAAFFAATGTHEGNPWFGASSKLKGLEKVHAEQALKEKGERLIKAVTYDKVLQTEIAERQAEALQLKAEIEEAERSSTVARWKRAGAVAAALGFGTWTQYGNWFESGRPADRSRSVYEYADENWPEALRFNDADRDTLRKWRDALRSYDMAVQMRRGAETRRAELLQKYPELAVIKAETRRAIQGSA